MKRLCALITILLLLLPIASMAEISDDALHSIGKFLVMDFQTASDRKMKKLLSDYFFVKEIGDEIVITKDLILSIPALIKESVTNLSLVDIWDNHHQRNKRYWLCCEGSFHQ